jgi:hypothetical protein
VIRLRSVVAALCAASAVVAEAQAPDSGGVPGSELTVYLMTIGQGDQVWERFGHNAIGLRNARTNRDVVFNWGLFSFSQPGFIGRFLRGEMMYWTAGFDAAATIAEYRALNRTIEIQELNLSPAQRLALAEFIQWNTREENKFYRYNYFLDNCSTRVRDVLDQALGGAIREATDSGTTGATYRDHALRLLAADPLLTVGVDMGLGRPTDVPLTPWEEMFIPMRLRDYVRMVRVPDESGQMVPLVTAERVVFQAERAPPREAPPPLLLPLALAGIAIAWMLAWLHRRARTGGPGARRGSIAASITWCVVVGLIGIALVYLRFWTEHTFAHDNTNVFTINPIWILLAVLVPFAAAPTSRSAVSTLALMAGALTVLGVAALFLPGFSQDSLAVALLVAPPNLVVAWAIRDHLHPLPAPDGA